MNDKHIRHYLQQARQRLTAHEFNRVVNDISLMEDIFGLRTLRYNQLPMGYDNQLFKEYVLKNNSPKPEHPARPWSQHFFGVRTYNNNSIVVVCPPLDNHFTKDAQTKVEKIRILNQVINRDIAAYNIIKPSFKPRLRYRVTDLILHSANDTTVMIFQEGMFKYNERAQSRFLTLS